MFITCPGGWVVVVMAVVGGTVTCAVNTLPVLQSRAELVHREMLRCIDCSLSLCRRRGGWKVVLWVDGVGVSAQPVSP